MDIDFANSASARDAGFVGFHTVAALQDSACADVPAQAGVYLFWRVAEDEPVFLATSTGGHFKGRNPTEPITILAQNWVAAARVLYIGKAGGNDKKATLQSRLRQYMRFGMGQPVGHWGGRLIWQLADARQLIVCWQPSTNEEPAATESRLIQQFKASYGKRPFANLRD